MTELKRSVAPFKANRCGDRAILTVTPRCNVGPIELKISAKRSTHLARLIGYKIDLVLSSK